MDRLVYYNRFANVSLLSEAGVGAQVGCWCCVVSRTSLKIVSGRGEFVQSQRFSRPMRLSENWMFQVRTPSVQLTDISTVMRPLEHSTFGDTLSVSEFCFLSTNETVTKCSVLGNAICAKQHNFV